MDAYVNNYNILYGWLKYLEEVAQPLVGSGRENILTAVKNFGLLNKSKALLVECPLAGDSGKEFSMDLYSNSFARVESRKDQGSSVYDNFLQQYNKSLEVARELNLVLDTRSGTIGASALFLDISGGVAELALRQTLAWQGEQKRLQPLLRLMERAQNLEPAFMGFVFAKNNLPIRISFRIKDKEASYRPIVDLIEKLGFRYVDRLNRELEYIDKLNLFDYRLNLDMMPNGSVNNSIGIELYTRQVTLEKQVEMLYQEQYLAFVDFLKRTAKADGRVEELRKCMFFSPIKQALGSQELLISAISHFILRYGTASSMPAKVCLRAVRTNE